MKKHEMIALLRSAGVDENAVTLATNAWEMGAECQKEECALLLEELDEKDKISNYYKVAALKVREMK
jgi:hypothetical protein